MHSIMDDWLLTVHTVHWTVHLLCRLCRLCFDCALTVQCTVHYWAFDCATVQNTVQNTVHLLCRLCRLCFDCAVYCALLSIWLCNCAKYCAEYCADCALTVLWLCNALCIIMNQAACYSSANHPCHFLDVSDHMPRLIRSCDFMDACCRPGH